MHQIGAQDDQFTGFYRYNQVKLIIFRVLSHKKMFLGLPNASYARSPVDGPLKQVMRGIFAAQS
jgi:hypothetical protein